MGGSQLTKLKEALSQAGLNRKPPAGKKRKRESSDLDNDKRAQKLNAIKQKLNPFDTTFTKLKHDVGGRKIKGVTGKPQQSKQAGIEQRKKTLLKEHKQKGHAGAIIDRRIGENDPTMTPEERMLERFTKERQRTSKGAAFNLEDEDELTHYGQSLSKLDDFDNVGLGLRDDDDDEDDGKIDQATVKHAHFGGFEDEDEEDDDEPARKKSKAEVMAEVIAKSKQHKYERQIERQQNDATRQQLDDELDDIRGLLFEAGGDDKATKAMAKDEDKDYDVNVKELVFDRRAKPKDRSKTEEELALEAKEALEKAERKRLRRMNGEDWDSSDDDAPSRKKDKRPVGADDLEDDFQPEDGADWGGLGDGLASNNMVTDNTKERDAGSEDDDSEEEEDDEDDDDSASEKDSSDDEDDVAEEEEADPFRPTSTKTSKPTKASSKGLPFTFPCPESNEEFLAIIEDVPENDVPTVIQRIRALHHPSLAVDNKFKLQALTGVLIDYIIHITSPPEPNFSLVPSVIPHLYSLSESYPVESATHFVSKLKLMQKNLTKGLSQGATSPHARTWPGPCELAFLWAISDVWSTSDMNHPVVSPARLLMGSYLGLCRVRSLSDLASGIFLCNLFRRYEELSKRLVPEVPNFLLNALLFLAPHRFKEYASLPGSIFCPDFHSEQCRALKLSKKSLQNLQPQMPSLAQVLEPNPSDAEQHKMDLLGTVLELVGQTAEMYRGLDGNVEILRPILDVLNGLKLDSATDALKTKLSSKVDMLARLLKFASAERKPLQLQQHKPIPIATYIPKFESATSSYLRRNDPDRDRAEASKLRYQYKQERKGAIRELRKDAKFMAVVKHKEQEEKDRTYKDKMNRLQASFENEQAQHKKLDKEKLKEKKRAGRK